MQDNDHPDPTDQAAQDPPDSHREPDPAGREKDQGDGMSRRLRLLNQAVRSFPDAPANYALRGELFLARGQVHLAQADFERALALASRQMAEDDWGLVHQAAADRALVGLRRLQRYQELFGNRGMTADGDTD